MARLVPRRNNMNEAVKQQTTLIIKQKMNTAAGGWPWFKMGSIESSMTDGKNANISAKAGDFEGFGFPPSGSISGGCVGVINSFPKAVRKAGIVTAERIQLSIRADDMSTAAVNAVFVPS